jgi:hypothetical protein
MTRYTYQEEKTGFSVWTVGLSGSKQDCLAFTKTHRQAQTMVDRLYNKYEEVDTETAYGRTVRLSRSIKVF